MISSGEICAWADKLKQREYSLLTREEELDMRECKLDERDYESPHFDDFTFDQSAQAIYVRRMHELNRQRKLTQHEKELDAREQNVEREEHLNQTVAEAQAIQKTTLDKREIKLDGREHELDAFETVVGRTELRLDKREREAKHTLEMASIAQNKDPEDLFMFELPDGTKISMKRKYLRAVEGPCP